MEFMELLPEEIEPEQKKERKLRLPCPPVKEPHVPEPRRPFLIRMLRSPLNLTLGVMALTPLVVISEATQWKFAGEVKVAFLAVIIALIFTTFIVGVWVNSYRVTHASSAATATK